MKIKVMIAVAAVFILCTISNISASDTSPPLTVVADGNTINFDVEPIISEGRTLVPMRYVFDALGAKIEWHEAEKTVVAEKNGTVIKIKANDNKLYKNGKEINLDVSAKLVSGRMMIPIRAVAQALDSRVEWDGDLRLISIDSKLDAVPLNGIRIFNEDDNYADWERKIEYNYDLDGNGNADNIQLILCEDGGSLNGKDVWNNRIAINGESYTLTDGRTMVNGAYIIDIDKSDNCKEIAVMLHYVSNSFHILRYENGTLVYLGYVSSGAGNNPHLVVPGNKMVYDKFLDDYEIVYRISSAAESVRGKLENIRYNDMPFGDFCE